MLLFGQNLFFSSVNDISCLGIRLVELAPQYFLGNLPASDGKELLMELRHSLAPPPGELDSDSQEHNRTQKDLDRKAETQNQSNIELCIVQ